MNALLNPLETRRLERRYLERRDRETAELDRLADELGSVGHWTDGAHAWIDEIQAIAAAPRGRYPIVRAGERAKIPGLTRRIVLRRDNHRCRRCQAAYDLQLDHVIPWSSGGSDRSDNLQTLCEWCNNDRSNFMEAGLPRMVGVTAVCDPCLYAHDRRTITLHDRSGLWFACPMCRDWDAEWRGDDRVPAYCGTCDWTSWVSDYSRIL